jgi:hypothetical protein
MIVQGQIKKYITYRSELKRSEMKVLYNLTLPKPQPSRLIGLPKRAKM